MIFKVNFPEARPVTAQIVQNRAWVDKETIHAEIWPIKKATNANTDGYGLPYKNSHKIFTLGELFTNMRIVDGTKKYLVSEPQDWGTHREAFLALVIMDDLVSVDRQGIVGTSPTGTPKYGTISVFSSMPCYIRPDTSNVVMAVAGETSIVRMKLFCDMAALQEKDVVTDLNTGSKYKIINVKQYTQIAYTEILMLGGVL